jgi:predicted ATPase
VQALPEGVVTFLFSDIEGSTRLLDELGAERYSAALAEHRRHMREAFTAHGGVEVDTQGDAFFVAFGEARFAVTAAAQAQDALAPGPIRVRMGIHTGEPLLVGEGYVGIDVHQAARVMSAGHGGQVLVSDATYALIHGTHGLTDLGLHRLKDLTEPQRLWQLGEGEFPPLKTLYQTNLPVQPTPLVGREAELGQVLELLESSRLVTLTGPGGSGKTRLALQAAAELVDKYKDGVWWVSLAALRDPELVEPTVAQVVGAKHGLDEHLRSRRSLLLLDNFEQLLDAAPRVAQLLREGPEVDVLATSRERLGIATEHEYAVPTMLTPEAVALFTAKARQLKPAFEPDDAVAEVCRHLDCLPLAIELAAGRIKVLTPEQIRERLGRSLELLTAGARDAPERQQTLGATIAWSYDLLDEDEKQLFARLAVFAGSFSLEAAEAVCHADLNALAALVDKSLLRRTEEGRFFMLETIREYAVERLLESSDANVVFTAHAEHYAALAESEAEIPSGVRTRRGAERIAVEMDNVRAAIERAAERADNITVARFIGSLWTLWLAFGHAAAAIRWAETALVRRAELEPWLRLSFLSGTSELHRHTGNIHAAEPLKIELLDLHRSVGSGQAAATLADLADMAFERDDLARARALAAESAAEGGGPRAAASLAEVELREGNLASAARLFEESAEGFQGRDDFNWALLLEGLGETARRSGDMDRASSLFSQSARELLRLGHKHGVAQCLDGLAAIVLSLGDVEGAARIAGAASRQREQSDIEDWRPERFPHDLPADALARGREMDAEPALEYALTCISGG